MHSKPTQTFNMELKTVNYFWLHLRCFSTGFSKRLLVPVTLIAIGIATITVIITKRPCYYNNWYSGVVYVHCKLFLD